MSPLFPCSCFLRVTPLCFFFFSTHVVVIVVSSLSRVRLFAAPWTIAHQVPSSMGFFRQEHWTGLPFPSPGDLSSHATHVSCFAGRLFTTEPPEKPSDDGKKQIRRVSRACGHPGLLTAPTKGLGPNSSKCNSKETWRGRRACVRT